MLSRSSPESAYYWQPEKHIITLDPNKKIDAVVNLNGANIGEKRWNQQRKQLIVSSRVQSTQLLCKALAELPNPIGVFVNASAIGFYGDTGQNVVPESGPAGDNFLAELCIDKENACNLLSDKGVRIVHLRTALVLAKHGGALKSMLPPFYMGLGGKIGSGQQLVSWISLLDECRAIEFLLEHGDLSGPFNLASPHTVTNLEWTKTLGAVLKRPTVLPLPAWWVKVLFGEMGELLLLGSVGAYPQRLLDAGFTFNHPQLDQALQHVLK